MSEHRINTGSEVFVEPAYMPRIGNYDGRAIEQALAGATLFEPGVRLQAAVVEATYASREPPLLKRLREEGVPYFLDLQTLRFASPTYLEVGSLASLPYAPAQPLTPDSASEGDLRQLAQEALLFQQKVGARHYAAPALPVFDSDPEEWMRLNRELLVAASQINGGPHVDRRPLTAVVAPGRKMLAEPQAFLDWLLDVPIDAVYVQPLTLKPTNDSIEKLAQYVRFLGALQATGLSVIAGRVGAFGLLLQALGVVDAFDSGLGDAEAYSYSQAVRAPAKPEPENDKPSVGGRDMRIYLEPLKTTLASKWATPILEQAGLRSRFTCALGCCQHRGFEELASRRRQHYLWTRHDEIAQLSGRPTQEMRLHFAHDKLLDARETAAVVRRAFVQKGLDAPNFEHLDRWIGLLSREAHISSVA